jgi:hypothetical protein
MNATTPRLSRRVTHHSRRLKTNGDPSRRQPGIRATAECRILNAEPEAWPSPFKILHSAFCIRMRSSSAGSEASTKYLMNAIFPHRNPSPRNHDLRRAAQSSRGEGLSRWWLNQEVKVDAGSVWVWVEACGGVSARRDLVFSIQWLPSIRSDRVTSPISSRRCMASFFRCCGAYNRNNGSSRRWPARGVFARWPLIFSMEI